MCLSPAAASASAPGFFHSYRICPRCTRKRFDAQALALAQVQAQALSQAQTLGAAQLQAMQMSQTPTISTCLPVVVRKMPDHYEGVNVDSCKHFRWVGVQQRAR